MPGSTLARRASGSTQFVRFTYLEKSMTTATLAVAPVRAVPPPRLTIGASNSRQTATVATTASTVRGTTTPIGTWR